MNEAIEHRLTLFAEHPDPTRDLWVGFVEVVLRYADGRQAVDVHTFDDAFPTQAAALAAAEAWVAQYKAALDGRGQPVVVERL